MERCLFLLELGETPLDRFRVARDDASQQIQVAQRDRREHMMVRPSLDQQVDDVTSSLREHGRPPDDIHSMEIADTLHIRTGVEQRHYRFERATAGGKMQRKRVVTVVTSIWFCAVLEQQPDSLGMMHGDMEGGRSRVALASEAGLARKQFAQRRDVTRAARREKGLDS